LILPRVMEGRQSVKLLQMLTNQKMMKRLFKGKD
jgi:hypothetical protein